MQGAVRISKQGFMPSGATPRLRLLGDAPRQHAPFRPAPRASLAQIVQVTPQVDAPINISLGSAPVVIGAFVGAGAAVAIGAAIPEARTFTTLAALGLAGFGVYNLLKRSPQGDAPIEGGGELPGSVSTPGGGSAASAPIAASSEQLVAGISGRVISPAEFQTVDLSPFTSGVPIRVRLSNPASQGVTFDLVLIVNEIPVPFEGGEQTNSVSSRVSLGAGETRDVDIPISLVTWGWSANQVDVYLTVQKRTIAGGAPSLVDTRHFVVD